MGRRAPPSTFCVVVEWSECRWMGRRAPPPTLCVVVEWSACRWNGEESPISPRVGREAHELNYVRGCFLFSAVLANPRVCLVCLVALFRQTALLCIFRRVSPCMRGSMQRGLIQCGTMQWRKGGWRWRIAGGRCLWMTAAVRRTHSEVEVDA